MRPVVAMLGVFAFMGVVAVVPAWMYFTHQHPAVEQMATPTRFMIQLTLPAVALLLLASWFGPGGGS